MPSPRLVLASSSPQRVALLRQAGYQFLVHPGDIDETPPAGKMPREVALHLALAKAQAVAPKFPEDLVLGADTVVAFGDQLLGKPADAAEARSMLELLAGTTHIVITGVALVCQARNLARSTAAMSAVHVRQLAGEEIERYIASGLWQGKAGGYGIQDDDPFVTRTAGSHSNIVGLPMGITRQLLTQAGITI